MLELSDIKSSPEELQDYYAQLCAQHVDAGLDRRRHQHRAAKQGGALPVALAGSATTGDAGGRAGRYPAGRAPGLAPDQPQPTRGSQQHARRQHPNRGCRGRLPGPIAIPRRPFA
jgi:hypothetical protein